MGHPVSDPEAREISDNLLGFFNVLAEWDAAEKRDANLADQTAMMNNKDVTEQTQ
jgi:hypothetical protein